MKTLGLIGGISWVSTVDYYTQINQLINERLGGLNYARCLIYSFNYADIKKNNDTNDWDSTFAMVFKASEALKAGGVTAIVLCANTMHHIADRLESAIGLPVLHIASATASAIQAKALTKVGLLGTSFTMEWSFFKEKLTAQGIETIIPGDSDRAFVHTTIFDELGKGIVRPETKTRYITICQQLIDNGAEGIILGCTEIPLVVKPDDLTVPVFDTAQLHSAAAVAFVLDGSL